jgi:hypothetical protein
LSTSRVTELGRSRARVDIVDTCDPRDATLVHYRLASAGGGCRGGSAKANVRMNTRGREKSLAIRGKAMMEREEAIIEREEAIMEREVESLSQAQAIATGSVKWHSHWSRYSKARRISTLEKEENEGGNRRADEGSLWYGTLFERLPYYYPTLFYSNSNQCCSVLV